jgi:hypothetical protein
VQLSVQAGNARVRETPKGKSKLSSTRENVRFRGVLRGRGQEATCTIEAIKVTIPGGGASALTRKRVVGVSKELPEGVYHLSVNGEVSAVRYSNGHWQDALSLCSRQ